MLILPLKITAFRIEGVAGLDPVDVLIENVEPGKGRLTVRCFADAWTAWWGAMGDKLTVEEFLLRCDKGYIAGCLERSAKRERYLERIADAIREALAARALSSAIESLPENYEVG